MLTQDSSVFLELVEIGAVSVFGWSFVLCYQRYLLMQAVWKGKTRFTIDITFVC